MSTPTLDSIYIAQSTNGVALYCDECGQEIVQASPTLNVDDALLHAALHIKECISRG